MYCPATLSIENSFRIAKLAAFAVLLLLGVVGCGGGGGGGGNSGAGSGTPPDTTPPITIASPASGTYGSTQNVTLTSNKPATIYYSRDGVDPVVGAANTTSGASPISGIALGSGGTTLKFFAVDASQNKETVKKETYVVDLTSPTLSFIGSAPAALGLLQTINIGWQSDKAGRYAVELGGTGVPNSGQVLATGSVSAASTINQSVAGSQLSYAASTPLWIYVTDSVGHTGATSVGLTLKPLVTINIANGVGQIAILPDGLKAYIASGTNAVDVIDTNPASTTFNTVLKTISVGTGPEGIAAAPDGSRVYVTNQTTNTISVIASSSDTVIASIPLGSGSAPNGIAITPDGTRAYFLRFQGLISVLDINPASPTYHTVTTSIPRPLLLAGSIAITPDGTKAVVNWQGTIAHAVDVVDVNPASPTYNSILSTPVPVVSGLDGDVAVTSDSTFAYATDMNNLLCRINLLTDVVDLTGLTATQRSFALTPDGSTILMGNSNNLSVVKASDLTLIGNVMMGTLLGGLGGRGIALTPDGTRGYVTNNPINSQVLMVPLL